MKIMSFCAFPIWKKTQPWINHNQPKYKIARNTKFILSRVKNAHKDLLQLTTERALLNSPIIWIKGKSKH